MLNKIKKIISSSLPVIIIALIAFTLRSVGSNWDEGRHLHPDERFLTMVMTDMRMPKDFAEYMDPSTSQYSPFNHNVSFYVYGGFPITLVKTTAIMLDTYFPQKNVTWDSYDRIPQIGRFYNTLCDIGILLLVYSMASKYLSQKVGILAAILYSVTVIAIQQSNFFTMDLFGAFFMTLALKLSFDFHEQKKWYTKALFIPLISLAIGLGMGSKISSALVVAPVGLILILSLFKDITGIKHKGKKKIGLILLNLLKYLLLGIFLIIISYLFFRLAQPFIFKDSNIFNFQFNQKFADAFNYQYALGAGKITAPFTIQWYTTINYITPFLNLFFWSIGLGVSISAIGGALIFIISIFRKKHINPFLLISLVYIIMVFIYYGGTFMKNQRYFLPLIPFAIIFAANFISTLDDSKKKFLKVIAIFLLIISELWALSFLSIYSSPNTRASASVWYYTNIKNGATVSHESWDDQVPFGVPGVPNKSFTINEVDMYRADDDAKIQYLYDFIQKTDYIVLASSRQSGSVGKLPEKYPYSVNYYKFLFSGGLGYTLVHKESSFPSLFGVCFNDESAEESIFIYDHPSVWIFEKQRNLTFDEFSSLLKNGK